MNKSVKLIQNLFTHKILIIKLAVKELQSAKFYTILLVLVMLAGIFSLSPVISSLMNNVIIRSTGRIATAPIAPIAYENEIRGVYIAANVMISSKDYNVIAETLAGYNINLVVVDTFNTHGWGSLRDELPALIPAFHSRGIKVHGITAFPYVTLEHVYNTPSGQEHLMAMDDTLTPVTYACPTKIRDHIRTMAEDLATFDIDGFMFDYIRYGYSDQWVNGQRGAGVGGDSICYCPECKAKLEAWLGETITNWPGDFAPGGSRYMEFMEWRVQPITELVRDVREWMLAINPDLEFSAAVWSTLGGAGRRYWFGQDSADWVAKGYLDFVAPMLYVDPADLPGLAQVDSDLLVGGLEGKIPMPIWITNAQPTPIPLDDFKQIVEYCRQYADGWIIWRYGGPGTNADWADITPYLDKIRDATVAGLLPTLTIRDIAVDSITDTSARITWTTDLPATSKVEYSTDPLFTASYEYHANIDFHYWDVNHAPGAVIEEATPITNHSITLTDLLPGTKYYFRVQSQDASGIATSKVLTFTTKS